MLVCGSCSDIFLYFPVRSSVRELPNVTVRAGELSPLRNVLCFARPCDVSEMRLLLLEYGAFQSSANAKRWEERKAYDMMEAEWLANFHRKRREDCSAAR